MEVIYLTPKQADKIRGRHGEFSELMPILLDDGNYVLPIEVLEDIEHIDALGELMKCESAEIEEVKVIDKMKAVEDFTRVAISRNVLSKKAISIKSKL